MYYKTYQIQKKLKGEKRANKFGAIRTHGFDSKKEFNRYRELLLLEKAGEVSDIQTQVKFTLYGQKGSKICTYKADFVYTQKDGTKIIEDTKSPITCTPVFKLKWKMLEDMYQEEIKKGIVKLVINLAR